MENIISFHEHYIQCKSWIKSRIKYIVLAFQIGLFFVFCLPLLICHIYVNMMYHKMVLFTHNLY